MSAPSELVVGQDLDRDVEVLLETVLGGAEFEAVTASEIAKLADCLQQVLTDESAETEAQAAAWQARGWTAERAEAIALALAQHWEQKQGRKRTANDNAGTKKRRRGKNRTKKRSDVPSPLEKARSVPGDGASAKLGELSAFLDVLEVPLLIADERQAIVYVNRACFEILDPHAAEFLELCAVAVDELEGAQLHCLLGGPTVGKRRLRGVEKHTCNAALVLGGVRTTVKVNHVALGAFDFSGFVATLQMGDGFPGEVDRGAETRAGGGNRVRVQLAASAEELLSVSQRLASTAEETSSQANLVSAASEEVSENLHTVASGMEELSHSISEIARSASSASTVAATGVDLAETTNETVAKLGDSSSEIGKVIKVITTIAQQTNLLALNATIEAARAGEAGKGFAVVANEVKELAKETASASEDISRKVEAIQSGTADAVAAISEINNIVNQINEIQLNIAAAVEEQTATAGEIGRNIGEAARGSAEITENIAAVATAARSTSEGAMDTKRAAEDLNRLASQWGNS